MGKIESARVLYSAADGAGPADRRLLTAYFPVYFRIKTGKFQERPI